MNDFARKVYEAVKKIPRGRVASYKDIARAVGSPRVARAVGRVLKKNYSPEIPCHRVVCSNGRVGGYNKGGRVKIKILQKEGVKIKKGQIFNLGIFQWKQTSSR